ncbi:MAG: hypothetical protein AAGI63_13930 [Planctomycetota bacterium]
MKSKRTVNQQLLRDKDYVLTVDGLIFNVIGYEHTAERVLATLKYVHGRKWTEGYQQGLDFLRRHDPVYVDEFVSVPRDRVARHYFAREGLKNIRAKQRQSRLESTAIELAESLSNVLSIPFEQFGVTDSLLWGGANEQSDIDLVVVISSQENNLLTRLPHSFQHPKFERLRSENFSRDLAKCQSTPSIYLQRTYHKGLFDGCRFSLRAIRSEAISDSPKWVSDGRVQLESKIASTTESLFFPVVYQLECGNQVVSYFTEHEGVFRCGDQVLIDAEQQQGETNRLLVAQESDRMQLLR